MRTKSEKTAPMAILRTSPSSSSVNDIFTVNKLWRKYERRRAERERERPNNALVREFSGFRGCLHVVVLFRLTKGKRINCPLFYSNEKELHVVWRGKKKFVVNLY